MRDALAQLRRYAAHDHTCILLEGERGCGKTVLARHAHEMSPRRGRTFRALSLAAADDALVSSDLFGHAKGAFTGADSTRAGAIALATGGTLFLDEIGKASTLVQGKLLHVVEEDGEFFPVGGDRPARADVRFIFAANEGLDTLVDAESFSRRLARSHQRVRDSDSAAARSRVRHRRSGASRCGNPCGAVRLSGSATGVRRCAPERTGERSVAGQRPRAGRSRRASHDRCGRRAGRLRSRIAPVHSRACVRARRATRHAYASARDAGRA